MTSGCDRIIRLLRPYVDGELSGVLEECVAAHLERCEDCAARASALREPVMRLRSWPQVSGHDLLELASWREDLVTAFAVQHRPKTSCARSEATGRRPRLLDFTRTATQAPAVRWAGKRVVGALKWCLAAGTRAAARGALNLFAADEGPRRQPGSRGGRDGGSGKFGVLGRVGRSARAAGGAGFRAVIRAGSGAIALG